MAQQEARTGATVAPAGGASVDDDVVTFGVDALRGVREHVGAIAERAGLAPGRAADLVLAVHEIASNSVLHGGGQGELRIWVYRGRVTCEVHDDGWIRDPSAVGTRPPSVEAPCGRGLWIAKQLCDVVQIRSSTAGTIVRLQQVA